MRWVAIVFLAAVAAALLWRDWPFLTRRWRWAQGRVTGHRRSSDADGDAYAPVVTFSDEAGRWRELVGEVYYPDRRPAEGAEVRVVYPEGQPERARLPHPGMRLLIYAFVLGMLGILIFLAK